MPSDPPGTGSILSRVAPRQESFYRKSHQHGLAFAVVGCLVALFVLMFANSASAADHRVRIVNNTIDPIIEFYALPGRIRGWDDARNLLPIPIRPGQKGEVVVTGDCRLNLLAVFADGTEAARWELNLCKRTEVTFYD